MYIVRKSRTWTHIHIRSGRWVTRNKATYETGLHREKVLISNKEENKLIHAYAQ